MSDFRFNEVVDAQDAAQVVASSGAIMKLANEVIKLLVQSAGSWLFDGDQSGLSDREWMAFRFLARANKFSRTPSALASFLGTTRSTASQIAAVLEKKGFVARKPSPEDGRSIALFVTPQGEKFLERDPINALRDHIAALEPDDKTRLRDALRQVVVGLDLAQRGHHTDVCGQCMFLAETRVGKDRHFKCRYFRQTIAAKDRALLCTHFERRPQAQQSPQRQLARRVG